MTDNESMRICKLCHSPSELLESHYIPKAAYKIIRQKNQAPPVLVSDKVAIQSDKQIVDRLLCATCEDRFNKNGEGWALEYCFRGDDDFKLKRLIQTQGPAWDNGRLQAYAAATIPEIDIEKLAYFAASIIWRGAVHQWKLKGIPVATLEIVPKYEEELRLYLLGEAAFPTNAVVWVSVVPSAGLWDTFTPAYGEKDPRMQFWKYRFTLLGITFLFLLGNRLDPQARRMCTYRSSEKWIYSGEDVDKNLIREIAPSMRTARPVGALAQGRRP
jgi:hypothetical protein